MRHPIGFTDEQLMQLQQAAKTLLPSTRDEFLRGVARRLGDAPSDAAQQAYRNTATHHESPLRHRADNRSVSQMVRDHQANMAAVYAAYDRDLTESWRQ
jgi:hypothetical protein